MTAPPRATPTTRAVPVEPGKIEEYVGCPVTHKIYRDAHHRSRLVLPFTVV